MQSRVHDEEERTLMQNRACLRHGSRTFDRGCQNLIGLGEAPAEDQGFRLRRTHRAKQGGFAINLDAIRHLRAHYKAH